MTCKCGQPATSRCDACKKLLCREAWHFRAHGHCELHHAPCAETFFKLYHGDKG